MRNGAIAHVPRLDGGRGTGAGAAGVGWGGGRGTGAAGVGWGREVVGGWRGGFSFGSGPGDGWPCDGRDRDQHAAIRTEPPRLISIKATKSMGLVRKSNAPRFIAVRMLAMSPYAETMMVDSFSSFSWNFCEERQSVHPRHIDVGNDHVDVLVLL